MIKLVSEPKFSIIGPRLLEFSFLETTTSIRFDYVLERFSLLIDFCVIVRIFFVVIVVSRIPRVCLFRVYSMF